MNKPVSFDLAKLLKEKGFDRSSHSFYVIDESEYGEIGEFITNPNDNYPTLDDNSLFDTLASAPTIADVVMWLYEKNGIWVLVDWSQTKWCFSIIDIKEETVKKVSGERWKERSSGVYLKTLLDFNSPTEAYEAAIEYCLTKLI